MTNPKIEVDIAEILQRIETKFDQVEFASRGILIGISVVILGGFAMAFGLVKP